MATPDTPPLAVAGPVAEDVATAHAQERRKARRSPWLTSIGGIALALGVQTALSAWIGHIDWGPWASQLVRECLDLRRPAFTRVLVLYGLGLVALHAVASPLSLYRLRQVARAVKLFWLGVVLALMYPVHSMCNCLDYLGASDRQALAPMLVALAVIGWQVFRGWRERARARARR